VYKAQNQKRFSRRKSILMTQDHVSGGAAITTPQPFGRIIRRKQLAELANHSLKWVDLEANRKGSVLVKVRNAAGRSIGFTEASVRTLLGCTVSEGV